MVRGRPALIDRQDERTLLDRLADTARGGWSAVLVIRGEPGIGKTALLEYAVGAAKGLHVISVTGVESEAELGYAGLTQLCNPLLDRLEELPVPQREALATVFGLTAGNAPDRFLVGLAVLSLLSAAGQRQPLLCVIDDAQWLDRASVQAILFAARRLQADPVAMVFATRADSDDLSGLPELVVRGLPDGDAVALLDTVIGTRAVEKQVRDQVIAEARGNPLVLLELLGWITSAELTGGFAMSSGAGLAGKLERSFLRRYQALPAETQRFLLVAASDPTGDPVLVWKTAARLGIPADVAVAAETAGLVTLGLRVVFRNPLVRSVVYRAASPDQRRAVHQALAHATDARAHPARRAWHRALAVAGPDEEVAAELEKEADRARAGGGAAAAAAFLERATTLTLDPGRRAERALAAAQAKQEAGAYDAALALLDVAEAGPLNETQQARAGLLRGRVTFALHHGRGAVRTLLRAASEFEPTAPVLARDTYLEALSAALIAGRLADGEGLLEAGQAVRSAGRPPEPRRAPDLLLDGLALLITDGYAPAVPLLTRALNAIASPDLPAADALRWFWLAGHAAGLMWDFGSWDSVSARFVELGHETGALTVLPVALSTRAGSRLFAGDLAAAASLGWEETAVAQATGSRIGPYASLGLAAFSGNESEALRLIEAGTADVLRRGEGAGLTFIQWAAALLHNGLGRYQEARDWARQASGDSRAQRFTQWALAELIEAAVRVGDRDQGLGALQRLSEGTQASATDWALGIEARSRALVSSGQTAERPYREAIERLGRTPLRPDLGRAHLLYGEWLSGQQRRQDAREQLRRAHAIFADSGMAAFAERARAELQSAGERVLRHVPQTAADLTAQEAQIARLAAGGATNAEIAARLFISASTVDYHLRKVFRKLGVTSRRQLARWMLRTGALDPPSPAVERPPGPAGSGTGTT
jgi:DNA-binding CsgD family transcriptional regulator